MRLPPPIAAGKYRVKEMALAVEWLPEEWHDGIPSLKQLLVVAPLTASILLPFRTENTTIAACGHTPVVHVDFCLFLDSPANPATPKLRFAALSRSYKRSVTHSFSDPSASLLLLGGLYRTGPGRAGDVPYPLTTKQL